MDGARTWEPWYCDASLQSSSAMVKSSGDGPAFAASLPANERPEDWAGQRRGQSGVHWGPTVEQQRLRSALLLGGVECRGAVDMFPALEIC